MLNSNFFAALLLLAFTSGFFMGHLHFQMNSYGRALSNLSEKNGSLRKEWEESTYADVNIKERALGGVRDSRPSEEELVCGGDGNDVAVSIDPFPPDFC